MHSLQLGGITPSVRHKVVGAVLSKEAVLQMPAADYMNAAQLEFFRSRLIALLDALKTQGYGAVGSSAAELTADPMDRASAEESQAQALRAHARDSERLTAVQRALELIEAGDYGWCEETGDEIGLERLMAQPTATLSYEAQERREKQVKFRN